jgi:hypothetical protein
VASLLGDKHVAHPIRREALTTCTGGRLSQVRGTSADAPAGEGFLGQRHKRGRANARCHARYRALYRRGLTVKALLLANNPNT